MKLRTSFVSNSSSASFIVSQKKGQEPKVVIETRIRSLTRHTIETENDLEEWLKDRYDRYFDKDFIQKKRQLIKSCLDKGETVYICECSNEDGDAISGVLFQQVNDKSLQVIDGEIIEMEGA